MARKRRRFYAGVSTQKATTNNSVDSILDVIAAGNTHLPAFDTYWMLYQKHPWVAACVNLIANTIAGDGYSVQPIGEGTSDDLQGDDRIPQIDEFFRNAFKGKITHRRAMFSLAVDLLVFGCGYWRKTRVGGKAIFLERVDPRFVLPKPNAERTEIEKFVIRKRSLLDSADMLTVVNAPVFSGGEDVDPKDMIFFTLGGGDQLLGAPSPLEHLDHTIGLDLAIRKHRQAFFTNGAVPGGILALPMANREQAIEVENRINNEKRGPDNAYRTWVLNGQASYQSRGIEAGEKDIDFVQGSALNRDEVCAVYHVPPGKLLFSGNALGSSGKAEDDATFQEQCVLPLEEAVYEILTRDLLSAEFDMEDIELAPQRRHSLRLDMFQAAESLVKIGGTGNEARTLVNLKKMDDPKFEMDAPLFIGATGQGVLSDEPLAATENTTPESDALNGTNDANKNEVAAKAKPRFPY